MFTQVYLAPLVHRLFRQARTGARATRILSQGAGSRAPGEAISSKRSSAARFRADASVLRRAREPGSALELHPAQKISLSEHDTLRAEDVIGGGRVKIEVRLGKGEQEIFRHEGQRDIADTEL